MTSGSTNRSNRFIAIQVVLGFGLVSVVALLMCAMFLVIIQNVSGLVVGMRHDEESIAQGLELATEVRELSCHFSRSLVSGDDSHVSNYESSREAIRRLTVDLKSRIPQDETWRLELIAEQSDKLHGIFRHEAMPAVRAGEKEKLPAVQGRMHEVHQDIAKHADVVAKLTASKMAHAHVMAIDWTRIGLIGGASFVALVFALSVAFSLRLRAAVLRPLVALTEAARHFGQGRFDLRVGEVGKGELAALGVAFDRMADELAKREKQLVKQERMAAIGQLAAGVAHELNNPIGIIRGYLKTMHAGEDPETLDKELRILDEEASHCQRIAADLLAYARSDELELEEVSVPDFIQEVVERFSETPVAQGCSIDLSVSDGMVKADSSRLRQVLFNLLTNACQVSPQDGTITVQGKVRDKMYEIEVCDQGPGVPEEERSKVFEPFYTKRKDGSGLGLAVCAGIVRAHGGTIEVVHSAEFPPSGAVFRVCLPISVS